jgi:hypothetical protein
MWFGIQRPDVLLEVHLSAGRRGSVRRVLKKEKLEESTTVRVSASFLAVLD